MFEDVMALVLAGSYGLCEYTQPSAAHQCLKGILNQAIATSFPRKRRDVLTVAKALVESNHWPDIWRYVRHEHGVEIMPLEEVSKLYGDLRQHFLKEFEDESDYRATGAIAAGSNRS